MTSILILSLLTAAASDSPALARGAVVFQADFEGPDAAGGFSGQPVLAPLPGGGQSLVVERAANAPAGSSSVSMQLPLEKVRGCRLLFSARVKAENVSAKPKPWNGVKFMAPVVSPRGKQWPAANFEIGSFDWQPATFSVRVPDDAQSLTLVLGLESVSGKVWFDDIRVTVNKLPIVRTPQAVAGPLYKGHDLPRLRGAMVPQTISPESLLTFGREWNANVIRWQLTRSRSKDDPLDLDAYQKWLDGALEKLDAALPVCEQAGLYVVVDLHSPPGGRGISGGYAAANAGFFSDRAAQAKFLDVWRHIATRYKNAKAVWGYDLVNEPVEDSAAEGLADWQELAEQAARAIRQIDPQRTIIVEPAAWGGPDGFLELRPIDVPHVVYSFHMYMPHQFTHQGVHGTSKPISYPGVVDGKLWDKAALEAAMQPAIEFQKTYGVHLYVGEFSAIRWAPGESAANYLRDLIELFEAHGWDWSYHAFREWDGWSVEHGPDPKDHRPTATPNARQQLLRQWLSKNQKPQW